MENIHNILKTYWGYSSFRSLQEEIIQSVLAGNDTLALLPTGGGKSVCFQVPGIALGGLCVVISPLIALMKDQVEQLKRRNIKAAAVFSGMSSKEVDITLDNAAFGAYQFLYVSPERLQTSLFLERSKAMNIRLLAIDEAHCISQWGYDFRPPYLQIADFRRILPAHVPCLALTATATEVVKKDITEKLQFRKGFQVFQKSFSRANLSYSAFELENKEQKLIEILQKIQGSAVVYVRSRRQTQVIAQLLQKNNISADFYHAGLAPEVRSKKQDDWIQDKTRVIVATNAFGMGIDKPDVRVVIHTELPDTLEAYYQEAGRAGRDEQKAYATVLYHQADIAQLRQRVEQNHPEPDVIKKIYQSLANYYQLAAGSGELETFPFALDNFAQYAKMPVSTVFQSLKVLENEGFIQLNDAVHTPSKLMIVVDNLNLYEFQIKAPKYDLLIKLLLRIHGGELFSRLTSISEPQLADILKLPVEEIIRRLEYMQSSGFVTYQPQKNEPTLTFLQQRFDAKQLPLNLLRLKQKKEQELQKIESVVHYLTHPTRCRTALLLEYFGEIAQTDCGVCDNCLKKKKQATAQDISIEKIKQYVLQNLATHQFTVQQLAQPLSTVQQEQLTIAVRELLDEGKINYEAGSYLKLV